MGRRGLAMPEKNLLFGLIVTCVTVRRSLCELEIKAGNVQVVAQLDYESNLGIELNFNPLKTNVGKLVPTLTLDNVVNQLRATEVVDLQSALANELSESVRIQQLNNLDLITLSHCIDSVYHKGWRSCFTCPLAPPRWNAMRSATGHTRHRLFNPTGMKAQHQPR